MVMSHTQELVFLCMLNFFILVQSSADGPEHFDYYIVVAFEGFKGRAFFLGGIGRVSSLF